MKKLKMNFERLNLEQGKILMRSELKKILGGDGATCVTTDDCPVGECCSEWGFCGSSYEYCGVKHCHWNCISLSELPSVYSGWYEEACNSTDECVPPTCQEGYTLSSIQCRE